MFFKDREIKIGWRLTVLIVLFGVVILAISLIQASWATLCNDDNLDRFRINPVEFEMENSQGDGIEKIVYNLPQIDRTPKGFVYEIKKVRDQVWLNYSSRGSKHDRANLYMLLADKKIAEVLMLSQSEYNDGQRVYDFSVTSVKYLKKVSELALEMDNIIEISKLKYRIDRAKFIYGEVFRLTGEAEGEVDKYRQLVERLSDISI